VHDGYTSAIAAAFVHARLADAAHVAVAVL
jgi:hypothetical protein